MCFQNITQLNTSLFWKKHVKIKFLLVPCQIVTNGPAKMVMEKSAFQLLIIVKKRVAWPLGDTNFIFSG